MKIVLQNCVYQIEVKGMEHFKSKTYRIPYKYKTEVAKEIQNMLQNMTVENNIGELRLCLDAPNMKALMNIEAIFDRINGSNLFTKKDLKHNFWLIPFQQNSRDYTALSIVGVQYKIQKWLKWMKKVVTKK